MAKILSGFFREPNGDYMRVYAKWNPFELVAEAAEAAGRPETVRTTHVSEAYFDSCVRVEEKDVPPEWLHRLLR